MTTNPNYHISSLFPTFLLPLLFPLLCMPLSSPSSSWILTSSLAVTAYSYFFSDPFHSSHNQQHIKRHGAIRVSVSSNNQYLQMSPLWLTATPTAECINYGIVTLLQRFLNLQSRNPSATEENIIRTFVSPSHCKQIHWKEGYPKIKGKGRRMGWGACLNESLYSRWVDPIPKN